MRQNQKLFNLITVITLSFLITTAYQACGKRYKSSADLSSTGKISSINYEFMVLDKINSDYRSLSIENPVLSTGPVYKVLISDKKETLFSGLTEWSLSTIPLSSCVILESPSNPLEADLNCTQKSTGSISVKIYPNKDKTELPTQIDLVFSVLSETDLLQQGQILYQQNCNMCHSSSSPSYKKDRTADQISAAIFNSNIPFMFNLTNLKLLNPTELRALEQSLKSAGTSDTQKPTITINKPTDGQLVNGTIQVELTATDETSLEKISLEVDSGIKLGADQTSPPFVYSLDTTSLTKGEHFLKATAFDSAGNTNSVMIKINIDNTIPPIADTTNPVIGFIKPIDGEKVSNDFITKATASDNIGVVGVKFYLDNILIGNEDLAAPFEQIISTTNLANGSSHQLKAEARDAAGNKGTTLVTFIVDNTPPTVTIIKPTVDQSIANTFTIEATATDSSGIQSIKWKIDGTDYNTEDTVAPYSADLDTTTLSNGVHTLMAVARDKAGNTNSSTVTFKVNNSYTDPYSVPESILAETYPPTSTNILAGKDLFEANCAICHNTTEKRDRIYSVYRSMIGPNSSVLPMKNLDLVSADVYKIYLYLTNSIDTKTSLEQSQALLGTRTYIASLFENIFISTSKTFTEDTAIKNKINTLILTQPGALGGACKKNDFTAEDQTCKTKITDTSGGQMLPNSNTIRRGYINRACDEILSIDRAVSSTLEKADLTLTSTINTTSISAVYDLFTPGRPIPANGMTALTNVANDPQLTNNTDKWRFVIYAICRSIGVEAI